MPWDAALRMTQLAGGRVRFVLASSGHIAGIINPPAMPRPSSGARLHSAAMGAGGRTGSPGSPRTPARWSRRRPWVARRAPAPAGCPRQLRIGEVTIVAFDLTDRTPTTPLMSRRRQSSWTMRHSLGLIDREPSDAVQAELRRTPCGGKCVARGRLPCPIM